MLIVWLSIPGLLSKLAMDGFFITSYIACCYSAPVEPVPPAPGAPPFIILIACFIISGLFIISLNMGLFIMSPMSPMLGI